ncbi:hypothetical protein KM043_004654 [Ampulex compressa]|nr:hypothetical protein KM043_004654 [Ampulex compressa]
MPQLPGVKREEKNDVRRAVWCPACRARRCKRTYGIYAAYIHPMRKQGRQISLAYQCWRMARRHLRPRIMGSLKKQGRGWRRRQRELEKPATFRPSEGSEKGSWDYRQSLRLASFYPSTNRYRIKTP